jgi:aminopeptidase N
MHRHAIRLQIAFVAILALLGTACTLGAPAAAETLAAMIAPAPGAAGAGDPYFEELGNGGYDVEHYTLMLDIDPIANVITATATITARATRSLSAFNLDFVGLTIDSVTVNDISAAHRRGGRELTITPAKPLSLASAFTVVIVYHGSPKPILSVLGRGMEIGWFHSAEGVIHVVSEPDGAASWFPVNDHPRDKATYLFDITVPEPFTVTASGLLQDMIDLDGKVRTVWEMNSPMASYLAAINVGEYDMESIITAGGIPIRYYFPPDFSEARKDGYFRLPEMMGYFSDLFGPYPFQAYGVIIAHPNSDACNVMAAIEIQTLSTHCPSAFAASTRVVAHELAHQWFGDSVSLENWSDIWLKEGLATYAEWLWLRRSEGVEGVTALAMAHRQRLEQDAPIGRPQRNGLYASATYEGAAVVFHALRLYVGEDAFFEILRTYHTRFRGGAASTQDFIALAEEVSGQELDEFFKVWLYADEAPMLVTN